MAQQMSREKIKQNVLKLIKKHMDDCLKIYPDIKYVNESTNLTKELGFDSLDIAELILDTEKTFGIHFPDTDFADGSKTVADIINCVDDLLNNLTKVRCHIIRERNFVQQAIKPRPIPKEPIELVTSDYQTFQFQQGGRTLYLNDPCVEPFVQMLIEAMVKTR